VCNCSYKPNRPSNHHQRNMKPEIPMTPSTNPGEPSAGAVRATELVCNYIADSFSLPPASAKEMSTQLALIIDRETGIGEAREALRRFGTHRATCAQELYSKSCNCGLREALAKLEPSPQTPAPSTEEYPMKKPKMKPFTLQSWHGKSVENTGEADINYQYGDGCHRSDMRVLHQYIPAMIDELERRGYDLSTFRLEIRKPTPKEETK